MECFYVWDYKGYLSGGLLPGKTTRTAENMPSVLKASLRLIDGSTQHNKQSLFGYRPAV